MIKSNVRAYDFVRNVLSCSASYLKKASQFGTEEYYEIIKYRNDNPGMKIEVMEKKAAANRPVSITFAKMEGFISQCRDQEARLQEFRKVKALSKIQASPYAYVKTWFLNNYANYSEQPEFDEDGYVVVKTKEVLEAEIQAQKAENESEVKVEAALEVQEP